MTDGPLGALGVERFLSEFWQRKPCLVRQAIPDLEAPLDGDDLAGLACDPDAEARLISGRYPDHDWKLRHGPFGEADFAGLPRERWTLLVQDVEKHYPPLQEFMARFDFLPAWRIDDLMISWSAVGGSVGPHVDQYDVFLLQAEGDRLWQIAERFDPAPLEDCELEVLQAFEAEQEWVLHPGDMLYLPPNVAHHGVALDPGMTWSVGLRAPSAADLLMALGENLGQAADGGGRYSDRGLSATQRAGEIDAAALEGLRGLAIDAVGDMSEFAEFAGAFLSRFRLARDPESPARPLDESGLLAAARRGACLVRNPWTRLAWIETPTGARVFAAGHGFDCSVELACRLCAAPRPVPISTDLDRRDADALTALVNGGHLSLTDM